MTSAKHNDFFNKESGDKYFVQDNNIDPEDLNISLTILAEQIEPNSTVIDVGCGQGRFGRLLKEIKNCEIYGIDTNEEAIIHAQNTGAYKEIFCIDLEKFDEKNDTVKALCENIREVDCIIFSDVLEHLTDPTLVLKNLSKRLKVGGKIVVSVPNVGHADIYLNLMRGLFNYTKEGILDNTHYKYFTKHSFVEWIKDINNYFKDCIYELEYLGGPIYYSPELWEIKEKNKILFHIIEANPEFVVFQLLFTLTKLNPGSLTPSLETLLEEKPIDVVELLISRLEGTQSKTDTLLDRPVQAYGMHKSERWWYEKTIKELNNDKHQMINRIELQEKSLQEKESELKQVIQVKNELHHEFVESQKYNNELEDRIRKDMTEIEKLEGRIRKDTTEIEKLEDRIRKDMMEIEELEDKINFKDTKYDQLEEELAIISHHNREQQNQIEEVMISKNNMENIIKELQTKISHDQDELNRYKDLIFTKDEIIKEAKNETEKIFNTLSWKITKPLRMLKRMLVKHT